MKRIIIFAIVILGSTLATGAQDVPPLSRTVFKVSPQHFAHNTLKAGVERFNGSYTGSFAIFATGTINNDIWSYSDEGYDGFTGEFQLRKYISPMKPLTSRQGKPFHQGIYGGVYAQAGYFAGEFHGQTYRYEPMMPNPILVNYDYRHSLTNGGVGFIMGYQRTLWQVVFLEAFLGGGIQFAGHDVSGALSPDYLMNDAITDPGYEGIIPKMGLTIGIGL